MLKTVTLIFFFELKYVQSCIAASPSTELDSGSNPSPKPNTPPPPPPPENNQT